MILSRTVSIGMPSASEMSGMVVPLSRSSKMRRQSSYSFRRFGAMALSPGSVAFTFIMSLGRRRLLARLFLFGFGVELFFATNCLLGRGHGPLPLPAPTGQSCLHEVVPPILTPHTGLVRRYQEQVAPKVPALSLDCHDILSTGQRLGEGRQHRALRVARLTPSRLHLHPEPQHWEEEVGGIVPHWALGLILPLHAP